MPFYVKDRSMTASTIPTIAAIATPPGRGGVGIVRLSGPLSKIIGEQITRQTLVPRRVHYGTFYDKNQCPVDDGIVLFFQGPCSFTGEDVVELQGHGGPVILNTLLQVTIEAGAQLASPGEFSKRAFLNDKIDLVQAEAVADLIDASSKEAAQSALRSLQGDFSKRIDAIRDQIIQLRLFIESALDFPEEEIDFIAESTLTKDLTVLINDIRSLLCSAQRGVTLREGMTAVIIGEPNVGKSSLMNALSQKDSAIVTHIAGTTRDVIREYIQIDGMPLHLIDTAGLRETNDTVEQEGIRRTRQAIQDADVLLLMTDASQDQNQQLSALQAIVDSESLNEIKQLIIHNKIDLLPLNRREESEIEGILNLSIKNHTGLERLRDTLKNIMGYEGHHESSFTARARHCHALQEVLSHCENGQEQFSQYQAYELLAEDLRQAQDSLNSITGAFTSDDLLGKIFSEFCIGK